MDRIDRLMARLGLAAVAACGLAGCGGGSGGPPRVAVAGGVTLDGQPLDDGLIIFTPTAAEEPVVAGTIEGGSYRIARADGPVAGPHRVSVWAQKPTGRKVQDDDDPSQLKDELAEAIPARYNVETELEAEIQERGDNTFDFELTGGAVARR